jgi:hypothetical protein
MKTILLQVFTMFLLIMPQPLCSQKTCCCGFQDENISEPFLAGELFTPDLPPDTLTYFNNVWLTGDIKLTDGGIVRNKLLKYNGLLDELFWLEDESKRTIKLDKKAIQQFLFRDSQHNTSANFKIITVKPDIITDSVDIFGEEIYRDKVSLYLFHGYIVERREQYYREGIAYQKVKYAPQPVYYFKFMNNKTVGLKELNRKNLYTLSPGIKKEINQFFRENKPGNYKDRVWLILLTRFLSTVLVL